MAAFIYLYLCAKKGGSEFHNGAAAGIVWRKLWVARGFNRRRFRSEAGLLRWIGQSMFISTVGCYFVNVLLGPESKNFRSTGWESGDLVGRM